MGKAKAPRKMDNASKALIVAAFFGGAGIALTLLGIMTGMQDAYLAKTAG